MPYSYRYTGPPNYRYGPSWMPPRPARRCVQLLKFIPRLRHCERCVSMAPEKVPWLALRLQVPVGQVGPGQGAGLWIGHCLLQPPPVMYRILYLHTQLRAKRALDKRGQNALSDPRSAILGDGFIRFQLGLHGCNRGTPNAKKTLSS